MRRFLLTVCVLFTVGVLATTDLNACGDKILTLGRGVRYQLFNRGSILLYKNPSLSGGADINDPNLYLALKRAGHKWKIATDMNELDERLKSEKYDLVIADASDVPTLKNSLQSARSKPLLVSVSLSVKNERDYERFIDEAVKSKHK